MITGRVPGRRDGGDAASIWWSICSYGLLDPRVRVPVTAATWPPPVPAAAEHAPRGGGRAASSRGCWRESRSGRSAASCSRCSCSTRHLRRLLAPYGFNDSLQPGEPAEEARPGAVPFGTDDIGPRRAVALPLWREAVGDHWLLGAGLATVISAPSGSLRLLRRQRIDLREAAGGRRLDEFPDLVILIDRWCRVVGPGMPQIIDTSGLLLGIAGCAHHARRGRLGAREHVHPRRAQSIGGGDRPHPWRHVLPNVTAADHRAVHDARRCA